MPYSRNKVGGKRTEQIENQNTLLRDFLVMYPTPTKALD